ncbi:hypothetical protein K461DRAFT_150332 [Myriangium duriaei CBS 260.36]|uniref:COP9 signalosome complex subunit 3 n=1 Tax=Myriangium duriaei CBS 260.36 TaxID=1168546 RepID=A0A9P4IZA5_9PEZI|nr:hypothetical protein K461DRAFT_150332 [Myriangium duriaei CBS 260.36]
MADQANLLLTDTLRPGDESDESYNKHLKDFVNHLRKEFSTKSAKRIQDTELLRVLHPATNTLGYIFLLLNINADRTSDLFIISVVAFLNQFDPVQARYAGNEWRRILDITGELVHMTQNPDLLIPYRTAILRMDPTSSTFTSNHLHYIQLCLEARRPREALPILDRDVLSFPYDEIQGVDKRLLCDTLPGSNYITTRSGISADLTTLVVQEYYLLGAQIYIGLRSYERASLFLELVLSTPGLGQPVNAFMVEAYKKLILVNLVALGKSPELAQIVEQPVIRALSQTSKPYEVLVDSFKNRNLAKFYAEVDTAGSLWSDDGNLGLVQEACNALRRHRVLDMQKTYAALPIQQIATHLDSPTQSVLQLVQSMIQEGYLQASISAGNASIQEHDSSSRAESLAVVHFHSWDASKPVLANTSQANPSDDEIKSQIRRIEALSEVVREADRRFSLTKEYSDWQRRNKKGADAGAAAYEDPMEMDTNFDYGGNAGDDEDIMAT